MNRLVYIIIGVLLLLASCKPAVPSKYIQPDDLEDLLVDYHLARAIALQTSKDQSERDYNQQLYADNVLKKHGVSKADFDSSLTYYYARANRLEEIYKHVSDRLDKQALLLGASEGEIGKYAALNANGDTANIWKERTRILLTPMPPQNLMDFEIEVDSTFYSGDIFLLQFMSDFVYQAGMKDGIAVLSINCEGDTVVSHTIHFSTSGINQLRLTLPADLTPVRLRGFIYLGGGHESTTVLRLLFIQNIQLIRFHRQHGKDTKVLSPDSLKSSGDGNGPATSAPGGGAKVGQGSGALSVDSGASSNRVVTRERDPKN